MDHKLTLKIDKQVIDKAKIYARKNNTSLSRLIEAYLQFITSSGSADSGEVTPLVKSLSGVIKSSKLPNDKDAYRNHLTVKYGK